MKKFLLIISFASLFIIGSAQVTITELQLWNSRTDALEIANLQNQSYPLALVTGTFDEFTVRAITTPEIIRSVNDNYRIQFLLNGSQTGIDANPPYVMWGNSSTDYNPGQISTFGTYVLKAVLYDNSAGVAVSPEVSKTVTITITNPATAISSITNSDFSVYLSPVTNTLYINTVGKSENIEIINIVGKTVISTNDYSNGINVSNLKSGVYFVKINNTVTKFIVQK